MLRVTVRFETTDPADKHVDAFLRELAKRRKGEFAVFKIKSFMAIWQINYCLGRWDNCERYRRAQRGEAAPVNLLPNGELLGTAPKGR